MSEQELYSQLRDLGKKVGAGYSKMKEKFNEEDIQFFRDIENYNRVKSQYASSFAPQGLEMNDNYKSFSDSLSNRLDEMFVDSYRGYSTNVEPVENKQDSNSAGSVQQREQQVVSQVIPETVTYKNLDPKDARSTPPPRNDEINKEIQDEPSNWSQEELLLKIRESLKNSYRG